MKPSKETILDFPQINQHNFIGGIAGVRPYRKGGLRIEKQVLKQKIIIHNYGHGGAGISLAPATAQQAVSIFYKNCQKNEQVAVLGSGIVGLFTALQAAKLGFSVVIYAKRIPKPKARESQKMCTSQVPPGYWLPYSYEFNNQAIHQQRSLRAFKKYLQFANQFPSISLTEVYQPQNFGVSNLPQFINKKIKFMDLQIGNLQQKMLHFPSLQINLEQFLQDLICVCLKKGVKFIQKELVNQKSVHDIPQKYIFNCLGLGSKIIFNDTAMYGKKGYLLTYRNESKKKWGIYGFDYQNSKLKFYILPNRILVGLTSQDSQSLNVDNQKIKELKNKTYNFLAICGLGNHPKL